MNKLVLVLLLLLPQPLWGAVVEGRVVLGEAPVPGVRVAAYADLDFTGEELGLSAPSDAEGRFRLELPAGSYAFYLHDRPRGLFAFCGRNPVTVGAEPVWVGLQAVPWAEAADADYDSDYSGAIEGRVLLEGEPLAGATVYLYLDVAEDLKGQGYRRSIPTGADGFFAFEELPESGYFLVARKRRSGERVGPVLAGDLLGIYGGNPLAVKAGRVATVEIPMVRKVKEAADDETPARGGGLEVRGQVVDGRGQAVAGVHVFAYTDRVIGHQRPAALSVPTGSDGRFRLVLPVAGVYYVGARQHYGDSPAPGELFGMYDETADHGLTVSDEAEVGDIRIVVEPVSLK